MTNDEWVAANLSSVEHALQAAAGKLYDLLGGEQDPGRAWELLQAEADQYRLSMDKLVVDPQSSGSRRSARRRPRRRDGR